MESIRGENLGARTKESDSMNSENLENTKSDNNSAIDKESNRKSTSENKDKLKVSKRGDTEVKNLAAKSKTIDGRSISKKDKKLGHRREVDGGKVEYKKVETNVLMGSIQRGIQQSVGGLASSPERDLLMKDFQTLETSEFPAKGGPQTPAHSFPDFTFRTYAPVAFR